MSNDAPEEGLRPLTIDEVSLVRAITTSVKAILPVSLAFKPQPDITAYELARLLPLFWRAHKWALMPNEVPTEADLLRHIEVFDPNKVNP